MFITLLEEVPLARSRQQQSLSQPANQSMTEYFLNNTTVVQGMALSVALFPDAGVAALRLWRRLTPAEPCWLKRNQISDGTVDDSHHTFFNGPESLVFSAQAKRTLIPALVSLPLAPSPWATSTDYPSHKEHFYHIVGQGIIMASSGWQQSSTELVGDRGHASFD
jgi:hypothetical protein